MAYCRFFVTVDWDEVTLVKAVNYELAEKEANALLKKHYEDTNERGNAYIFQDNVQIAVIRD
jgi:hypothetical protein